MNYKHNALLNYFFCFLLMGLRIFLIIFKYHTFDIFLKVFLILDFLNCYWRNQKKYYKFLFEDCVHIKNLK